MMTASSSRIASAAARLPAWLEKFLLLAACWQLAGIFWLMFAPATDATHLVMPRQRTDEPRASRAPLLRWYGADGKAQGRPGSEFSLIAVIAGRQGAAVLKGSDGAAVAVRVGDEIQRGSRLVAVSPDGVTVEQGGVCREIAFPQSGARSVGAASAKHPMAGAARPTRITRGQMAATLRESNVGAWDAGLSAAPGGGIRLERASLQPFARLLGLVDGDVLKRINQRPLQQVADISLISHYFGQHASVSIDLVRKGAAVTQTYEIQP